MEIINMTFVEAGVPTFYLVMSIVLWVCALCSLIGAIICWVEGEWAWEFIFAFICGVILGLGCFFVNRVKEPYYKYDVVFTGEEINMKEFVEKYSITGHNGNIYHIEDKH